MSSPHVHRGVYEAQYRRADGSRLAVAIDSAGRCVAELPVSDATESIVRRALWAVLEVADPASQELTA